MHIATLCLPAIAPWLECTEDYPDTIQEQACSLPTWLSL